jgi:hypothetical protein
MKLQSVVQKVRPALFQHSSIMLRTQYCAVAVVQVLITLAFALPAKAQCTPKGQPTCTLDGLEQLISEQMQNWKLLGLAIAVVQDGQVIYSHGFGLRDIKDNLPVTSKTIFAIGSISNLSMGMLNDEGKLDWDKPAVRSGVSGVRSRGERAHDSARSNLTSRRNGWS